MIATIKEGAKKNPLIEGFDKNKYATPQYVYDALNSRFNFIADLAAEPNTAKHPTFFTKEHNSLAMDWMSLGDGYLFLNPPYNPLKPWVKKAQEEVKKGAKVVMLVPADVCSTQLYSYLPNEIWFIVGRLSFLANGIEVKGNMHNSCVMIWDGSGGETRCLWKHRDSLGDRV